MSTSVWDDIKSTVSKFAPSIGLSLGGPLGGMAGQALSQALGVSLDDPTAIQTAANGLSGDQVLALKTAEIDYNKFLKQNDIDLEKIASDDRNSARQREIAVRDHMPAIMAIGITIGFFGILVYLLAYGIPERGGEPILIMLGALGSAFGGAVSYYFGSTKSSTAKDLTISRLSQ